MKLSIALGAALLSSGVAPAADAPAAEALEQTILDQDAAVFDAFNRCADPAQMERHAGYFDEDVEFYHDTGGVTWTRADMLANTRKYVCGHFTRELIPGSASVFPIKDFGAIERGSHRFCQLDSSRCEGEADFVIVWKQTAAGWKITRVLSFAHRAAAGANP
jgi:hypothetical protein